MQFSAAGYKVDSKHSSNYTVSSNTQAEVTQILYFIITPFFGHKNIHPEDDSKSQKMVILGVGGGTHRQSGCSCLITSFLVPSIHARLRPEGGTLTPGIIVMWKETTTK